MILVMKVGGASGPLYGTLFMTLGKELPADPSVADVGRAMAAAMAALKARGKADLGNKTMLDVLGPLADHLGSGGASFDEHPHARRRERRGHGADEGDPRPRLLPRRALHRSHGPGCALEPDHDRCGLRRAGGQGMSGKVGIVIVSHSPDVAKGAADMVRQMVGNDVPLGFCGGNPDGGLGTSVEKILAAIDQAWSEAGVAILVDLGGAETNSEMAIEMLPEERQGKVVICNAPGGGRCRDGGHRGLGRRHRSPK